MAVDCGPRAGPLDLVRLERDVAVRQDDDSPSRARPAILEGARDTVVTLASVMR
jgi:hypothetical protein